MNKRLLSLFFLLLLACQSMLAQSDSLLIITGRVIDARTRQPMGYVSVTAGSIGTVTNEQGEFSLKVRNGGAREITFSCVGYKSQKLAPVWGEALTVAMMPSSVMLSEIVVKSLDAKELVRMAASQVASNYPVQPNLLRGFYRETAQKRQRFISVAEGVVEIFKTGYKRSGARDGVRINKGRRLLSQRAGDTLGVKLQGGPVLPVVMDVVKEPELLLSDAELDNYNFKYGVPDKSDDRMLYVVEMTPRLVQPYALYRGRLYIDMESLSFVRIELSLDMDDELKATQMLLVRKPATLRFTPKELSLRLDYHKDADGLSRLNYVRNVIRFRCDWKRRLFKSNFAVISEMVTTGWRDDSGISPIRGRDSFNRRDAFYDKVVYFEDPAFWGTENIIEPTEDLLNGIEKIKRRLK